MGFIHGALLFVPLAWVASQAWALYRNYQAARTTGLPIIICPYDPENFFHVIFSVPLRPVFKFVLPRALYTTVRITTYGWEFPDKSATHDAIGPSFMIVSPGMNQLITADPAVAHAVAMRRKDFLQTPISAKVMGFLGANIVTSNGDNWSRQRRIVAPALNERISRTVWAETAEQATRLAEMVLSCPGGKTSDTIPALRTIAINVLSRVAYGHRKPFALAKLPDRPDAEMSYVDAISLCTELLVFAAMVPGYVLRLPFMPNVARTLGAALQRLPGLTADMLDQERRRIAAPHGRSPDADGAAPDTIMSTLVRLSDEAKTDGGPGVKGTAAGKSYLAEEEIAGNLFIFTAAGFDTTANTMAYAVALLAVNPEWQGWIQAELDAVLGPIEEEGEVPDYATVYPRLTRCLAVMFETLRVCPPVTHLMRITETAQSLPTADPDETFALPGPCVVYVNHVALHTSRSTWGDEALEFKPTRWIRPPSTDEAAAAACSEGTGLVTPPRGTFLPWSAGPRACPGQKMSQVEFVTTVATLFRRCRVEPVARPGETAEEARGRLMGLVEDSQSALTLQMKRPEDFYVRWVRR
ncbi:putative cytochrome P450 CYP13A3 [Colletotrichum chlorophyti]|uniref:Putative cytochrome P450 CYP13A3 n=1 Tax=Colletotrichum chlorophyti TaxID=708187 RepID=A0A1Q8RPK0_9PEZI|nr:putative cytochrome P450 CYP13A3 [Colletotrichum chlorophyti]